MQKILKAAFITLPLISCAPGAGNHSGWVNPAVSEDQASKDYSACRRYAERQAGLSERLEDGRSGDPIIQMERNRAAREVKSLTDSCMQKKGYNRQRIS